jgi:hypothetical protein
MRKRLSILGTIVALAALSVGAVAPAAYSNDDGNSSGRVVRWDLVQFVSGVVLAGGSTVSVDEDTGETLTLTGSGHAEPQQEEAFGGGTFTHERASDTDLTGAYYVTDFISWKRAAGSFEETGFTDGIGNPDGATSGRLKFSVAFVPEINGEPGPTIKGKLIIDCALPGAPANLVEGVRIKIGALGLDLVQHVDPDTRGFTLFHIIR